MDFSTWFSSLLPITKYYMCIVFGITLCVTYGMLSPYYLMIEYSRAFANLEIWRLLTCFCFAGKFSFNFLMYMMMIYQKLTKYEEEAKENNKYSDLVYLLAFVMLVIHIFTFCLGHTYFLCMELLFALIYIHCKRNPEQEVILYFWKMKNGYLPWAMLLLSVLIGGSILSDLIGIVTGHIYYFLKDLAPVLYGWDVLKTPQFLINWLDRRNARARVGYQQGRDRFTSLNNPNTEEGATFRPGYNNNNNNQGGFTSFSGSGRSWGS